MSICYSSRMNNEEMKKCMEESYQLLQEEYAWLNEMTLL
jgi:hypothetical protein